MRRLLKAALVVAGALVVAATVTHASGETAAGIVLDRADSVRQESFAGNASLTSLLSGASARVAAEFANAVLNPALALPPIDLRSRLTQAGERVAVEFANHVFVPTLVSPTAALSAILSTSPARVRVEFANGNRSHALLYPKALLNDRKSPVITLFGSDGVRILWVTDEFATSVIQIGLKSGTYTQTFTDASFQVNHTLPLPQEVVAAVAAAEAAGVPDAADATYFVRIASTDLSGNQATSREYSASTFLRVYLPMVDK